MIDECYVPGNMLPGPICEGPGDLPIVLGVCMLGGLYIPVGLCMPDGLRVPAALTLLASLGAYEGDLWLLEGRWRGIEGLELDPWCNNDDDVWLEPLPSRRLRAAVILCMPMLPCLLEPGCTRGGSAWSIAAVWLSILWPSSAACAEISLSLRFSAARLVVASLGRGGGCCDGTAPHCACELLGSLLLPACVGNTAAPLSTEPGVLAFDKVLGLS
jgi:hypothetical protein